MIKEIFIMLRDWFSGEAKTVKSLEKGSRAEYIWDYHKWKLIITVSIIFCAAGLVWTNVIAQKDVVYSVAIVNQEYDTMRDAAREAELAELFDIDSKKEQVTIDSAYQIVWETALDDYRQYADYDRFFLNVSNSQIDCAIVPEGFLKYCMELDAMVYPITELAGNIKSDRLFYIGGTPYGITTDGGAVACFPITGQNTENSAKLAKAMIKGTYNE